MPSAPAAPTVFLVDDSVAIRERIAGMLGAAGLAVVGEAASPQRSIDGILRTRPNVVVLDVQIDGGSGLDVLRAVRAADPAIPFVVFSNHAGPAYRKRYLGAGAADFLDKSSDMGRLAQVVAAVSAAPAAIATRSFP